ncbi:thioredoxin domain-containing protein 6-like [Palaemon carinicauda]|uniref:thioredoxin domain-containing protein 6-like n=1 Tax=Palaemon carinicauda TaxID=392227 RepID=UPI0035B5CEFE
MSRKKAEAQQLQIEIKGNDDWQSISQRRGLLVVDVYSEWCGPCSSMTGHLRRIKLELGDEYLTLATANADAIDELNKFRGKPEPTWLFFGSGKPLTAIHGADGPQLLNTIRRLLKVEVAALKGQAEREVVLLESLIKPIEILEPDEDLDDVEGQMNMDDSEGSDAGPVELHQGVLFIIPQIVAEEKTETFLSNIVGAGFMIIGHVQEEYTRDELHDLLFPPEPEVEEGEGEGEEGEGDGGDNQDKGEEEPPEEQEGDEEKTKEGTEGEEAEEEKDQVAEEDTEEDLLYWEEQLGDGPLYIILLKVEEGCVVTAWQQVLGPHDLEKAREEEPECLVALFGEEERVIPAWLPKGRELQERLTNKFFPPPPDASVPRLLIIPDCEHQPVLEKIGLGGIRVLAHTQASLQQESINSVSSLAASQKLVAAVGSVVLAVVVMGENTEECVAELNPLHLTQDAMSAQGEVELFFPDLLVDQEDGDEPQTQMQIEQSKESEGK